jgi:protoheme IX farnesyltransferase
MSTTPSLASSLAPATSASWRDYLELTKFRLSVMNVITAVLAYFAAGPGFSWTVFASLVLGTSLAAFGAAALNQVWEHEADARMRRTEDRPVAAGRMSVAAGTVFGLVISLFGVGLLFFGVNAAASALAAATIVLYVCAYTPLKKITPWATEIGAIPGALPPLIGWMAAGGGLSGLGWMLFAFLFAWQIPHFMAISWTCRADYARAGFVMHSLRDPSGRAVAYRALIWTVALIGVSLLPWAAGEGSWLLGGAGVLLGGYLLHRAVAWARQPTRDQAARRLFLATIAYLPTYLGALAVDRFLF